MASIETGCRISAELLRTFPKARFATSRKRGECENCGYRLRVLYVDTGTVGGWPTTYRYCLDCGACTDAERDARWRRRKAQAVREG